MASLTFPLSLAQFQDAFKIISARMSIAEPRQIDRTASGTILQASTGDPVWRGSLQVLPTNDRSKAAALDALLSVLDRAGSSFLVYDPRNPHPASDRGGVILSGSSPVIASLDADNRRLSFSGLPSGYVLSAGDLIGWQYGSSPTRYALHRIVVGATADGAGATGLIEVTPFIQQGVTVGTAVALSKPVMKAVLMPDPEYGAGRGYVAEGSQISFVQTLR